MNGWLNYYTAAIKWSPWVSVLVKRVHLAASLSHCLSACLSVCLTRVESQWAHRWVKRRRHSQTAAAVRWAKTIILSRQYSNQMRWSGEKSVRLWAHGSSGWRWSKKTRAMWGKIKRSGLELAWLPTHLIFRSFTIRKSTTPIWPMGSKQPAPLGQKIAEKNQLWGRQWMRPGFMLACLAAFDWPGDLIRVGYKNGQSKWSLVAHAMGAGILHHSIS